MENIVCDFESVHSLDDYQRMAHYTATYPDGLPGLFYLTTQLASEAGEVCGKFGKQIRDKDADFESPEFRTAVKKELGDCLWFLAELARQLDMPLSGVARANLAKLYDRKARGVLGGSGDDR